MLKGIRKVGVLIALPCFASCAAAGSFAHQPSCRFDYTPEVAKMAMDLIAREEREIAKNFSRPPAIVREGGVVSLIFVQQTDVLDPPSFIIRLDPCTGKIVSAGESNQTEVSGAPKH